MTLTEKEARGGASRPSEPDPRARGGNPARVVQLAGRARR